MREGRSEMGERGHRPKARRSARTSGLILLLCTVAVSLAASAFAAEVPFEKAPAFTALDLDGKQRTLTDFLNAKPMLLEFMSPDCPHCQAMAPILTRLHAAYGGRVQFLTVAFDRDVKRVQRFARQEKHVWPYLMGTQQVGDAYRLEGVPTFCLIAKDGRLRGYLVGSMPEEELRQHLDAILKVR